MVVDPELLEDLEKAVAKEKGLRQRGKTTSEGSADVEHEHEAGGFKRVTEEPP